MLSQKQKDDIFKVVYAGFLEMHASLSTGTMTGSVTERAGKTADRIISVLDGGEHVSDGWASFAKHLMGR